MATWWRLQTGAAPLAAAMPGLGDAGGGLLGAVRRAGGAGVESLDAGRPGCVDGPGPESPLGQAA